MSPEFKITLRRAGFSDAEPIALFTRAAWNNKVPLESGGHDETATKVLHDLESGGALIAVLNGEMVAVIRWFNLDGARELKRIGVLEKYRAHGIAQQLMSEAIEIAENDGVKDLRLAVRVDQPQLVKAYSLMGFRVDTSLTYSHANPRSVSPVVMRKYLNDK